MDEKQLFRRRRGKMFKKYTKNSEYIYFLVGTGLLNPGATIHFATIMPSRGNVLEGIKRSDLLSSVLVPITRGLRYKK